MTAAAALAALVAAAAVLLAAAPAADAQTIAQHMHVSVEPSTETIVTLLPLDLEGDTPTCEITALPVVGKLYQLSANYINFGYLPAKGTEIVSISTQVSDVLHRVVYEAPVGFVPTTFIYRASDIPNTQFSTDGVVEVTGLSNVTRETLFHQDADSWQVVAATSRAADWTGTSTGSLNHFIFGEFGPLVVGANNDVRWYFEAPASFHGNNARLYGGRLEFWMGHFEGDLAGSAAPAPVTFVELTCAACASGDGITIAQRGVTYTGGLRHFSFDLTELPSDGWLKDPHDDTVTAWPSPTQCEVVDVLAGLSGLRIYGDWVDGGHEVVGIDAVKMVVGSPVGSIASACY